MLEAAFNKVRSGLFSGIQHPSLKKPPGGQVFKHPSLWEGLGRLLGVLVVILLLRQQILDVLHRNVAEEAGVVLA